MTGRRAHRARIVASVAATAISLACGTNYVYSAWAPQFADRLKLSSTESNLIGLFGNMGMYILGFPVGVLIDGRGPRPAIISGMILLALGYFPLHEAYDQGAGSVPLLCFFSFLTGLGSCMAFTAAMKTSALNWPDHRGTATAFPLAAFGLSAFFFSSLGAVFFAGDTSPFLMLLACGTSGVVLVGSLFLRVIPHHAYHSVPAAETASGSLPRKNSMTGDGDRPVCPGTRHPEPGTSYNAVGNDMIPSRSSGEDVEALAHEADHTIENEPNACPLDGTPDEAASDESSSLISQASSLPGEILVQSSVDMDRSHRVDIRGIKILPIPRFWQLFSLMGILSGIGLMTIKFVSPSPNARWLLSAQTDIVDPTAACIHSIAMQFFWEAFKRYVVHHLSDEDNTSPLDSSPHTHVRLGVGSDFLVKVLNANRLWCIVVASTIFSLAQLSGVMITNPHLLGLVSGLSGLGYGFLFGVYPSIIAETFGIHGLSQNWGFITLAPALSGNIFNIFYGKIYDQHSVIGPGGQRICQEGLDCYKSTYVTTLCASVVGLGLSLWLIQRDRKGDPIKGKGEEED